MTHYMPIILNKQPFKSNMYNLKENKYISLNKLLFQTPLKLLLLIKIKKKLPKYKNIIKNLLFKNKKINQSLKLKIQDK